MNVPTWKKQRETAAEVGKHRSTLKKLHLFPNAHNKTLPPQQTSAKEHKKIQRGGISPIYQRFTELFFTPTESSGWSNMPCFLEKSGVVKKKNSISFLLCGGKHHHTKEGGKQKHQHNVKKNAAPSVGGASFSLPCGWCCFIILLLTVPLSPPAFGWCTVCCFGNRRKN